MITNVLTFLLNCLTVDIVSGSGFVHDYMLIIILSSECVLGIYSSVVELLRYSLIQCIKVNLLMVHDLQFLANHLARYRWYLSK